MEPLHGNGAPAWSGVGDPPGVLQEPPGSQSEPTTLKQLQKHTPWFIVLLVLFLCSAYCNTFSSPPVLDDFHSFVYEENVHKDLSVSSLEGLSRTVFGIQRWIPMVSFSLDLWFGKGEISYFHLTNLLIHLTCMLAVLFLIFNLVQAETENGRTFSLSPLSYAVWVAGLWALNPVQTNAVTYLVQRMASLQALFFVSSVAFYALGRRRHTQHQSVGKALPGYLASLLTAMGAFLSKENAAMLPVMLLVTEVWFFSPGLPRSVWKRLRAATRVVKGVLFLGGVTVLLFGVALVPDLTAGYANRHFTMAERLLTEARVVVWYLSLLLWPVPSRLSLEHDVLVSSSLLHPPTTLAAVVLLILLGWSILRYRKVFPLITYGGVWYFLNLLIESSIVPLELVFEHRLYLPSVGFSLVVVCVVVKGLGYLFAGRPAKELAAVSSCGFAVLFSVMTLLTFSRNEAWSDRVTIYQDAAEKAPNHPRSHANLAVAYAQTGQHEEAIREAELAYELGQGFLESYVVAVNAAVGSLMRLERYEEAIARAQRFLNNPPAHFNGRALTDLFLNLAQAHLVRGELSEAYAAALKAFDNAPQKWTSTSQTRLVQGVLVAILKASEDQPMDLNQDGANDPGDSSLTTWLAKDFFERGEREQARFLLSLAFRENPEDAEATRLLERMRTDDERDGTQIVKENRKQQYSSAPFSRFNASMALAYQARTPNRSAAVRNLGEKLVDYALDVQPGAADAHLLKAYYLHDRKEIEPAIAAAEQALALDPDYAKAWLALGYFRMELNEFPKALSAFQKGLELYPGCPQRQSVLTVIKAIEQNPAFATAQK